MFFRHNGWLAIALMVVCAVLFFGTVSADQSANAIIDRAGVRGGFVVHLGCGDGDLTTGLAADGRFLVQGLDVNADNVATARKRIHSLGLEDKVSVVRLYGPELPYIDEMVNLLVSDNPGPVSRDEIMRVLAPNGVALIRNANGWDKIVKPRPAGIDEWTHFLHGPDGNALANDSVVGAPFHIQWVGAPSRSKTHSHLSSLNVMVSSGGRVFYIMDDGLRALPFSLPSRWALYARDAFNGVTLWRRPLARWQASDLNSRNLFPVDLYRRLVADGDTLYTTLDIFGPVTALDAATGKTLRTYAGTEKTDEIIFDGGILYLVLYTGDEQNIDRRKIAMWRTDVHPKKIMAIEAASGTVLWELNGADTKTLMPLTLASKNGRVYFENAECVIALDGRTGKELWRTPNPLSYNRPTWSAPTFVATDKVVLVADRGTVQPDPNAKQAKAGRPLAAKLLALDAATGKKLWSAPCAEGDDSPVDIFVSGGLVWTGETLGRKQPDYRDVRDIMTGKVVKQYPAYKGWVDFHHHRCYRDKATEKYILAGRTGVEFIDLDTGDLTPHNWLRGNCKYGILPCNGLIYKPPDPCGCFIESKLTGMNALAPEREDSKNIRTSTRSRLEKGLAYGKIAKQKDTEPNAGDWPTYRADAARSGCSSVAISTNLKKAWETKLGGSLSQPVVVDSRLFVASVNERIVYAIDVSDGHTLWTYTTGGRIDSVPTIAQGMVVFGCRDGWVYALRASDGSMIWRFRAAPDDRQLVADDQVESVWPVNGSVLVQDGAVYCAAGRSSYLDDGIAMYKLDLTTGKPIEVKQYSSRDPKTGRTVFLYKPYKSPPRMASREMPGVLPDIMSSDGKNIWMRAVTFDKNINILEDDIPHLFSWMGFLDSAWQERSYWIFGDHFYSSMVGIQYARSIVPSGRLLVFDDGMVYGYQDETFSSRHDISDLFAMTKRPTFSSPTSAETRRKKRKTTSSKQLVYEWRTKTDLYPNGIVLAGDILFCAGSPRFDEQKTRAFLETNKTDLYPPPPFLENAVETFSGKKGAILWAVNKRDGKKLAEYKLDADPVFDGLIAANGGLYISTKSGTVIRMSDGSAR